MGMALFCWRILVFIWDLGIGLCPDGNVIGIADNNGLTGAAGNGEGLMVQLPNSGMQSILT